MIRSRRNERARRRIKIGRRSDNFRSWTKGFVRKKKKEPEKKKTSSSKKKKQGRRRTQQNKVCTQLKQQPTNCQHSRRSRLRRLLLLLLLSSFFSSSLSFFRWWRSLYNSSFSLNTTAISAMCFLSFLCYFVTSFEFWIPKSLTWLTLEWWKVLNF